LINGFTDHDFHLLEQMTNDEVKDLSKYLSLFKSHSILFMVGILAFLIIVILQELFNFLTFIGVLFGYLFNLDKNDILEKKHIRE